MSTRETGGYFTSDASIRPALREISVVLSPSAVNLGTSAEQSFSVPGVLATDRLAYINKPTAQAGLAIGQGRILSTADGLVGATLINDTTASITPTSEQVWVFGIVSGGRPGV